MRPAGAGAGEPPFSAAADRNKGPIHEVLASVLPEGAKVLEIASGTGQHAAHFATAHPRWDWQPSDVDTDALEAIATRCAGISNVRRPILLDVLAPPGADSLGGPFDAI